MDFTKLNPCDSFVAHMGKNIWLMDNHRWALLVWEEQRSAPTYTLVHADKHWDAVYDFHGNTEAEQELVSADIHRIKQYLIEDALIRYDSFIAPAIRRGLFESVHFFCTEDNANDVGIYEGFLNEVGATQVVHQTAESLAAAQFRYPVMFDLCLDLFNYSDECMTGDLWTEAEICDFLSSIRFIIANAETVTVSLSFDYSGTHEDTRSLAKLVLPILLSYRTNAY